MRHTRCLAVTIGILACGVPALALASHSSPHRIITHGSVVYDAGGTVAAAKASLRAVAAAASPGVVYGASTTQQDPILVQLSRDHRKVARVGITWEGNCSQPGDSLFESAWLMGPIRVRRTGRFSATYQSRFDDGPGITGTEQVTIAGRLRRDRMVVGTFSGSLTDTDQSGNVVEQCSSGPVSYRAIQ
jgi:hypothetical protein